MSDLHNWLGGHNLKQYAEALEANDVDLDVLPDLDDHDLEQLGLSLGNRRRLLKAIAARKSWYRRGGTQHLLVVAKGLCFTRLFEGTRIGG